MGIGEIIIAILSILCATFIGMCWIFKDKIEFDKKGDDK